MSFIEMEERDRDVGFVLSLIGVGVFGNQPWKHRLEPFFQAGPYSWLVGVIRGGIENPSHYSSLDPSKVRRIGVENPYHSQ